MRSVAAVCINRNAELSRTALMPVAAYLRGLIGIAFSCFMLRVLKKCSTTRGETDCKEVFNSGVMVKIRTMSKVWDFSKKAIAVKVPRGKRL